MPYQNCMKHVLSNITHWVPPFEVESALESAEQEKELERLQLKEKALPQAIGFSMFQHV